MSPSIIHKAYSATAEELQAKIDEKNKLAVGYFVRKRDREI